MRISTGTRGTFSRSFMSSLGWRPSSSSVEDTSTSDKDLDVKSTKVIDDSLPQNNNDEMFLRLRREAAAVVKKEPILCMLLTKVGLLDVSTQPKSSGTPGNCKTNCIIEPAKSFEEAIARIVSHRISACSGGTENICPKFLRHLLEESFKNEDELELGHTMSYAVREDAMAVLRRDPACETLLEAVLFMKGFHSLVLHRAARRAWKPAPPETTEENIMNGNTGMENGDMEQAKDSGSSHESISVTGQRFVALLLQSQTSSAFGVDIHPACSIGAGVMIDHASGVVIGETATVGDGTTILHAVTLGGTGKDHGDRHPKIGKDVLIGAGTKILGNITVGDRAKIGAGSVVLRPIPSGATAVGAPAKIIGFIPKDERPGSSIDMKLEGVEPLLGKKISSGLSSSITEGTAGSSSTSIAEEVEEEDDTPKQTSPEKNKVPDKEASTAASSITVQEEGEEENEEEISGSDDDNVTDFGTTPRCRWVNISKHSNDGLCPFRGSFRHTPSTLKENTISHSELRALLIQEGCSEGECVEVFFELLHCTPATSTARQCGCIPLDIFSHCFPEIAKEKTKLDDDTIQALAKGDLRALGMSKKASRRFKSMFQVLGRHTMPLPRISSSGLLGSSTSSGGGELGNTDISKSTRERMTAHLDTSGYAEGITI